MLFLPTLLLAAQLAAASAAAPAALESIAAAAGGTVGFAAVDLATGRALGLREREPFPLQSVFKLPIAIEVLRRADAGRLALERVIALGTADARGGPPGTMAVPAKRTVGELLEAMVVRSDNVACDKLLALLGGPRVVDARVRALGVDDVTIRFSEREMGAGRGDNTATPAAMVALLGKIARRQVGLSPASAGRLEELLLHVTTGPRRLRGTLPPGTPVAHKTGTSDTRGGKTDATNDVGLITLPSGQRMAIAVFVHASPADEPTREATIAALARAAYDAFNLPAGKERASVDRPPNPDAPGSHPLSGYSYPLTGAMKGAVIVDPDATHLDIASSSAKNPWDQHYQVRLSVDWQAGRPVLRCQIPAGQSSALELVLGGATPAAPSRTALLDDAQAAWAELVTDARSLRLVDSEGRTRVEVGAVHAAEAPPPGGLVLRAGGAPAFFVRVLDPQGKPVGASPLLQP